MCLSKALMMDSCRLTRNLHCSSYEPWSKLRLQGPHRVLRESQYKEVFSCRLAVSPYAGLG